MTGLRRQWPAIVALLCAVLAVVAVSLWLDVLPVAEKEHRSIVDAERTAEVSGQRITFESARWDEFAAADGLRALSVRLSSSGGRDAAACDELMLVEPATGRTWVDANREVDVPYDAGESSCVEESAPYDIVAVFLVPADAGPFLLDVPGDDDVVARFVVEP